MPIGPLSDLLMLFTQLREGALDPNNCKPAKKACISAQATPLTIKNRAVPLHFSWCDTVPYIEERLWVCLLLKEFKWRTYGEVDSIQFTITLLEPVVEVLGIVCRVPLTIRGHTEDSQGVVNLSKSGQLRLASTVQEYKCASGFP